MNPAFWGPIAVAALTAVVGPIALIWFKRAFKRSDDAAKLTASNLERMQRDVDFVSALLDDNADYRSWAQDVRLEWRSMQFRLKEHGTITEIHDLPPLPESRVAKLQKQRAKEAAEAEARD